ncbi:hypothetical protein [Couchioplanes azureus]|uniref:hypothetical protein n=1 Tax=Couchioplanes caeruleus TaxID=56438 RepID=UPI001670BA37|nr:hypothetical protein [Couchioplanes caeruleus]GGQ85581.1 hypothetical protein GCM10010166_64910 [Couchioplanes caeruleus subsp. azureus]
MPRQDGFGSASALRHRLDDAHLGLRAADLPPGGTAVAVAAEGSGPDTRFSDFYREQFGVVRESKIRWNR